MSASARAFAGGVALPFLLAVVWLTGLPNGPSEAHAAACTSSPRRGDGVQRWVGVSKSVAATKVEASLEEYSPYVASIHTYAFVQLVDSGSNKWAKMGWLKSWNGTRNVYTEANYLGTVNFATFSGLTGTNTYEVDYASGSFVAVVNGTTKMTWNASASAPDLSQILGETETASDQMAGDTVNNMNFTSAYNYVSGIWAFFNGSTVNSNSFYYDVTGVSQSAFNIWDKYC